MTSWRSDVVTTLLKAADKIEAAFKTKPIPAKRKLLGPAQLTKMSVAEIAELVVRQQHLARFHHPKDRQADILGLTPQGWKMLVLELSQFPEIKTVVNDWLGLTPSEPADEDEAYARTAMGSVKAPWNKPTLVGKKNTLTETWKKKAKARATSAGRKYPSLVDNMWATQQMSKASASTGLMLSAGVKYDPENPAHRKELADKMKEKLSAAGFKLSTDRTRDPGRRYGQSGWKGKEEVWVFNHRKDPGLEVQVFTSITDGGSVRSKGADAIRVCLVYKNKAKQQNPESEEARQYGLGSECRVHRTGDIDDIIERTVERARDAYKRANEVERCRHCGAPMATSKAGKKFCSEVCWTKKPGAAPAPAAQPGAPRLAQRGPFDA